MHKDKDGNTVKLARIGVRAATSKVRKGRTLLCRNGQYFERIKTSLGDRDAKSLVFSIDGEREVKLTLSVAVPKTFNLPLAVSLVPEEKRTNTPGSIVKLSPEGIVISQST